MASTTKSVSPGSTAAFDRRDLLHHRLIDGQTARRIDDHDIAALLAGVFDRVLRDLHGVRVSLFGVDLHADLTAQHLQLVDSGRTVDVAGDEQHMAPLLLFEEGGQLAREGRLARTLQTGDQDDGRSAFQADVGGRAAHELRQLVAHDLGHHLPRLDSRQHVLPQRFLLHLVGERLGDLVVDVGVDQRAADLFERLGDVDLCDAAFAFEDLERPFEFICQVFKHGVWLFTDRERRRAGMDRSGGTVRRSRRFYPRKDSTSGA